MSLLRLWQFNQFLCHVLILHCFYYFLKLFLNFIRIFFFFFFFPFHSFICSLGETEAARVRKALTLISQLHCSHLHFCSVFVSSLAGLELGKRVIFSFIFLLFFPFRSLWEKTAETDLFYSQNCRGIRRRWLVDAETCWDEWRSPVDTAWHYSLGT